MQLLSEEKNNPWRINYEHAQSQLTTAKEVVGELKEALKFYANEKNYDEEGRPGNCVKSFDGEVMEYDFELDLGYIAEQALKKSEEWLGSTNTESLE